MKCCLCCLGASLRLYLVRVIVLVAILVLIFPSWALALPASETPSRDRNKILDLAQIREKGELNVAVFFEDVPPFFMHNKQEEFVGIDVYLAKDIAHKLGVSIKFYRSAETFDALVDAVESGTSDVVISLLSDTLNRAMKVRFSHNYAVLRQTLLVNRLQLAKEFPSARTTEQIREVLNQGQNRIGVIAGTSYVDFLNADYPQATKVFYNDFSSMVSDLKENRLLALLYDELEIMNWRYEHPDDGLLLKTVLLGDRQDTIAIAVNRHNQDLLTWLNLYLDKAEKDGSLKTLLTTYLEKNEWRNQ